MTIATQQPLRAVIIGGGISGLSAAWYLEKQAAAHDIPPGLHRFSNRVIVGVAKS